MIGMKHLLTAATVLTLVATAAAQEKPADAAKTLAAFQGNWVITSINGQSLADSGMEMSLAITGNAYVQTMNGAVNEKGTIKVDTSKKPSPIDFTILEGDDTGKPQVGLIQIEGDVMTAKLGTPGNTVRPTGMAPEEGFFMVTAKRAK